MKKILLLLHFTGLFIGLDLYGSESYCTKKPAATCAIVTSAVVGLLIYSYVESFKIVTISSHADNLIIVSWYDGLNYNEKLLLPDKALSVYHYDKLHSLCARKKKNYKKVRCATDKSAEYNGIREWHIGSDLAFTPDFKYDKESLPEAMHQPDSIDNNITDYRSYLSQNQSEFIDFKKGNLRGY